MRAAETLARLDPENAETYREDSEAFYAMIEREIVPYFDMPYIARLVLARHARGADKEQRRRFTEAFKNTLMRTYADQPMSFADACLLRMAETHPGYTVMTCDQDFMVYRMLGRRMVPSLMPDRGI